MSNETVQPDRERAQIASHKRGWMVFFGLLLFMTIAGICLQIWFNEQQRLRSGQIDSAWERWKANRPAKYEFVYTVVDYDKDLVEYTVRVRPDGSFRVMSSGDDREEKLQAGDVPYLSMDELFSKMSDQLAENQQPGKPSVFAKADFDRQDGHVVRYIRSVRSTRERLEVIVKDLQSLED
jgi:hypothetical protein